MLSRLGWSSVLILAAAALGACVGEIDEPGGEGAGTPFGKKGVGNPETAAELSAGGIARLSAAEYVATVSDLIGIDASDAPNLLPQDLRTPFDNDVSQQQVSEALINSADVLAGSLAAAVIADSAKRDALVPCTPSGATDTECFKQFVESFGRRAFRRPLSEEQVTRFMALAAHGEQAGDFWVGVDSVLRAFLQHPQFLYRVEVGKEVPGKPGVFLLDGFERASRLSYLLWGSMPPNWLFDDAAAGKLDTQDGLAQAAGKLLEDARAKKRIARFHSMWLGYEGMSATGLGAAMSDETQQLLDRVIFEDKSPWNNVLSSDETFLTPELAEHYGLPAPSGAGAWVSYGDSGRRGLLSHASFLSAGAKFDDTSPTQRGLLVRGRLMCEEIKPPPPSLMVNVDEPPGDPSDCKSERYTMFKMDGCSLCHEKMDPIGFGLEAYDTSGRFRAYEKDRPDCPIDGEGTVAELGTFNGPGQLADRLLASGKVEACMATYFYRFARGRYELSSGDSDMLTRLVDQSGGSQELRFEELIVAYVRSEAFGFRVDGQEEP